jgi:hypothetical protein
MSMKSIFAIAAALGLLVIQMPQFVEAQVRQPQRLVQRPAAQASYGFPQGAGAMRSVPVRSGVRQVNYLAGGYYPQDAVQGEVVGEMESLPAPMTMDPMYSAEPAYYEGFEGDAIWDEQTGYDYDYGYEGFGSCFSGNCGGGDCDPCPDCIWHGLGGLISNADYRLGVHGFKNAANRDQDGSFGFHGGVNLGLPLQRLTCGLFSGSLGINSVQSNFAGSSFTEENRSQTFVTAALFRRVDQGLQFGVAYDYLQEDWYTSFGVSQLRSELSWVTVRQNTLGFRYTSAQLSDTTNSVLTDVTGAQTILSENWVAAEQYRGFFRKSVCDGDGYIEFSAGSTDESHTILALDFNTPLRNEALRFYGGFTYLVPQDNILASTTGQETWNVAMGIQISPYKRRGYCRFNQPMFDVADNGTFQIRRN